MFPYSTNRVLGVLMRFALSVVDLFMPQIRRLRHQYCNLGIRRIRELDLSVERLRIKVWPSVHDEEREQ